MGKKQRPRKPAPMKLWQAALILLSGSAVLGVITGGIAGIIAGLILKDRFFGLGGLVGGAAGMLIGYPAGIINGLILGRKLLKLEGSLWLGILGCLAGSAGFLALAEPLQIVAAASLTAYFIVAPLLGTGGFLLGRAWRKKPIKGQRK
jgi:hypothetical protein